MEVGFDTMTHQCYMCNADILSLENIKFILVANNIPKPICLKCHATVVDDSNYRPSLLYVPPPENTFSGNNSNSRPEKKENYNSSQQQVEQDKCSICSDPIVKPHTPLYKKQLFGFNYTIVCNKCANDRQYHSRFPEYITSTRPENGKLITAKSEQYFHNKNMETHQKDDILARVDATSVSAKTTTTTTNNTNKMEINKNDSTQKHQSTIMQNDPTLSKFSSLIVDYCIDEDSYPEGYDLMKTLGLECIICLNMIEGGKATAFSCKHMICLTCDKTYKAGCPVCRISRVGTETCDISKLKSCLPRSCPLCNKELRTAKALLDHLLGTSANKCEKGKLCTGCDCLTLLNKKHECPEDEISCSVSDQCSVKMKRKDSKKHLEICDYVVVSCCAGENYCGYKTERRLIQEHETTCVFARLHIKEQQHIELFNIIKSHYLFNPGTGSIQSLFKPRIGSNEVKDIRGSPLKPITVWLKFKLIYKEQVLLNLKGANMCCSSRYLVITDEPFRSSSKKVEIIIQKSRLAFLTCDTSKNKLQYYIQPEDIDTSLSCWNGDRRLPIAGMVYNINDNISKENLYIQFGVSNPDNVSDIRMWLINPT